MAIETDEERAAREAEEEAAREARRQEIMKEIRGLEDCRKNVEKQIADLEREQKSLNDSITNWRVMETASHDIEILSEVVIINVFEGVCADAMKEELAGCVAEMNQTCGNVEGLNGHVGTQIGRLLEYVMDINGKISSLQREYDSL